MSWKRFAGCQRVDTELFFPVSYNTPAGKRQVAEARSHCLQCPVVAACLEDALAREGRKDARDRYGIQGGRTPGERAAISKKRRLAPAA